jgi:acetyl-CoA carboxylase biotin carboxyl carrier protein
MEPGESGAEDVFDIERILRLVALMKEHDLSEIDLRQLDQRIKLRRGQEPAAGFVMPSPPPAAPSRAAEAAPAARAEAPPPAAEPGNFAYIKSPMVGTFYSRPNPDAPSFVKVGDHVHPETVVCIIEAMKVFNEIPAEMSGQIVAMLVENEEPVEFGKPLFKVAKG